MTTGDGAAGGETGSPNVSDSLAPRGRAGGAAADPFGAPPAADTEVIQRRGNNAPAPVPAAAPMDRKGR